MAGMVSNRKGARMSSSPLRPNGLCWDFCGQKTAPGAFFRPGHDKRAERYLNDINGSKSVAERVFGAGYFPGGANDLREDALSAGATTVLRAVGAGRQLASCRKGAASEALVETSPLPDPE